MKTPKNYCLIVCLFLLFFKSSYSQNTVPDTMLCVGNHWKEDQGKMFLDRMKASYTTSKDWEKRSKEIRQHILKGADLEIYPERKA